MLKLNKTIEQLKEDWELIAKSENYRNAIAQGFSDEERFKSAGESQFEGIQEYLQKNNISLVGKRIIEIGCGAGRMTESLADLAEDLYATDISMNMLHRFKERVGEIRNVTLLCTSDLSVFTDEFADIIFSYLVFQHLPEDLTTWFLKDGYRVLKSGGYYIFQLTTLDKHKVIRTKSGATDMVRWEVGELQTIADENDYQCINPPGSLFNIWRKK